MVPGDLQKTCHHCEIVDGPADELAFIEGWRSFPHVITQVDSPKQEHDFNYELNNQTTYKNMKFEQHRPDN